MKTRKERVIYMLNWKNKKNRKINERMCCFEKEKYNLNKVNYLPSSGIGKMLILLFITSDFMFIMQLVDIYFTQSEFLSMAVSLVIACLIDISPSILAGFITVKKKKSIHYVAMFITSLALIASFTVLGFIRLNSEEFIYQIANNQITSLISEQEIEQSAHTQGYMWMSVLFCIIPVFTSIVSFCIGLFESSKNKETYLDKINIIKSREELFNLQANNLELELELERNLNDMNDQYKELELDDIKNRKIIAKEFVKFKMAQAVKTPQALTNFMEGSVEQ